MEPPISAKSALLQALITGPGYGLVLIERVKERTKSAVVLGQGSIYPALRALERDGLLRSWDGETTPERGGRPRRYYELTAEGRRAAFRDQQVFAAFPLIPALEGET
jgi:PadR family transcriptional regulator, regulatory protein PadR